MVKSKDTATEHMVKQKKRKNLPNTMIYGSLDRVVEMHPLGEYEIENEKLKTIISNLTKENDKLNVRVDNTKAALKTILDKIEIIEGKLKTYGLK